MPRRHLSAIEVARVVSLLQQGYSQVEVAAAMEVSQSVISRAFARFNESGDYNHRLNRGRQRITTERDDRAIVREVRRHPTVHSHSSVSKSPTTISTTTHFSFNSSKSLSRARTTCSMSKSGTYAQFETSSKPIGLCTWPSPSGS